MMMQVKVAQLANQRTRILLVGLLGAILLFLLLPSVKPVEEIAPASMALPSGPANTSHASLKSSSETASSSQTAPLPSVDVSLILKSNPFRHKTNALSNSNSLVASRESTKPNRPSDNSQTGSTSSTVGTDNSAAMFDSRSGNGPIVHVSAVITGYRRPAALIENKIFFENDEVADGWVISSIRPDRVSFARTAVSQ